MSTNGTYRRCWDLCQSADAIRKRRFRQRRRRAGRCTRCPGVAVPGRSLCQPCLDAGRVRSRQWRLR